jgi:hypothetical protein
MPISVKYLIFNAIELPYMNSLGTKDGFLSGNAKRALPATLTARLLEFTTLTCPTISQLITAAFWTFFDFHAVNTIDGI